MRVLVAHPGPDFSVADVHDGWVKALRTLGCEVGEFNLHDRLAFYSNAQIEGAYLEPGQAIQMAASGIEKACYRFWPDLVVIVSGFFIDGGLWDLWKHRPQQVAVILTESPYEDDRQLQLVERADPDVVLVNDSVNLDAYKQRCARSYYMPHAYDPDRHYPGIGTTEDFVFVGTGYPSRIQFFEQVDWTGIDATFGGYWKGLADGSPLAAMLHDQPDECLDNEDTADLYRAARISANLYRGRDPHLEANRVDLAAGWACGPREIELAACETFFLREPRGESDLLFPMLPTFSEPDEFTTLLRWWLDHEQERVTATKSARARIEDRTFVNHARRLLQLLPI